MRFTYMWCALQIVQMWPNFIRKLLKQWADTRIFDHLLEVLRAEMWTQHIVCAEYKLQSTTLCHKQHCALLPQSTHTCSPAFLLEHLSSNSWNAFFIKAGRQTWIFNQYKLLKHLVLKSSKMRIVKSACLIFC